MAEGPGERGEGKGEPSVVKGQGLGKRVGAGKATTGALAAAAAESAGKRQQLADGAPLRIETVDLNNYAGSGTRSSVTLPLEVHARVMAKMIDGDDENEPMWRPADVLDRHIRGDTNDDSPWAYQYYVHFHNMNRRMDRWVSVEQMDLTTLELQSERMGDASWDNAHSGSREHEHKMGGKGPAVDDGHANQGQHSQHHHEGAAKVRNVLQVELGKHVIDTWYFSPFPAEYTRLSSKLYICEFTLKFFTSKSQMQRHMRKVKYKHPPGDEIYRDGSVAMFEVDGRHHREYCQNLCYLAKLFLDHKSLYYDTDLFLFYVQCEVDTRGYHVTGYFSKEKFSEEGYNLACILTLPPYQRKGYGKFLISFSYELSKKEGRAGTPERPLSDLGLVSYRSYWTRAILDVIQRSNEPLSINDIRDVTMIKTEDIVSTLQFLQMLGFTGGRYVIYAPLDVVQKHLKNAGSPGRPVKPDKLIWTPWQGDRDVVSRSG